MTTQEILEAARGARTAVALSDSSTRDSALLGMADALCAPESIDAILAANADSFMTAFCKFIHDVMAELAFYTCYKYSHNGSPFF